MRKFSCRAKFDKNGKVICCSQTKCSVCESIDSCEELDFFIESLYQGINECMYERSYKKVNGRMRQK